MPFNLFKSKSDAEYKTKLERKLVTAKETPEPIFDLCECNLKLLPNGIFSLCKVFRKECLFLQDNKLSDLAAGGKLQDLTLLKMLNLSCNCFSKLPEEICTLVNLEVFLLSNNHLTKLPESFGKLRSLRRLDLSKNKLETLPKSIGQCFNLEELNLQQNNLKKLPAELGYLRKIKSLLLDPNLTPPPASSADPDAESLARFLAGESGNAVDEPTASRTSISAETDYFILQEKLKLYDQQKEAIHKERLALEKSLVEENQREIEAHLNLQGKKDKLVEDIKLMQSGFDDELCKVQKRRDEERTHLIQLCLQDEADTNNKVTSLLASARKMQQHFAEMTERQDLLQQQLLYDIHVQSLTVENTGIIDAMNSLLQEEMMKANKFKKYEAERDSAAKQWISQDSELSTKLSELAAKSRDSSNEMKAAILADEEIQKAAVATLLEQSDARSWELANQVAAVERQLAELTKLELSRKKLEMDGQIIELSINRVALTELLVTLLNQQENRRADLVSALQRMEEAQTGGEFWLAQYQRLMDSASRQLVQSLKSLDNRLTQELVEFGQAHYLPLLVNKLSSREAINAISDNDLIEVGIDDADDRCLIIKALAIYLESTEPASPSAPPLSPHEPNAPPYSPSMEFFPEIVPMSSEECVVCMETAAETIFIPCGHMCCCRSCSGLKQCPLCRTEINTVVTPASTPS